MKYELLSTEKKHGNMETWERLPVDVANWLNRALLNYQLYSRILLPTITLNITFSRNTITPYKDLFVYDSKVSITSLGSQSQKATCSRALIADVNEMQSLSVSIAIRSLW